MAPENRTASAYFLFSAATKADATARVALFLDFAPAHAGRDVPDPYYGFADGFEQVLDLVEAGCEGLLRTLLNPPTDPR